MSNDAHVSELHWTYRLPDSGYVSPFLSTDQDGVRYRAERAHPGRVIEIIPFGDDWYQPKSIHDYVEQKIAEAHEPGSPNEGCTARRCDSCGNRWPCDTVLLMHEGVTLPRNPYPVANADAKPCIIIPCVPFPGTDDDVIVRPDAP